MISNTTPNFHKAKTATSFFSRTKKTPEFAPAVEEVKKLYQKYYASPNSLLMSQIKTSKLNIYLNNYNFNDISVINKILSKYFYFENLTLSPYDPNKKNPDSIKKNSREPLTEGEKTKLEKQKHDEEIEKKHLINKVTSGVGKHLSLSDRLLTFSLINFPLEKNLAENLSKGIIKNNSIKGLYINNCEMSIESYEILLKGLLNHEKIEFLDLSNNNLEDKYGNMISRIIARQTYRRDQVIWLYGLRNEIPLNNDYTKGLISINLKNNNLSNYSADCITTSLSSDQYIRFIDLSQNNFNNDSCKKFIHMLRQNVTLLNIDLRENPGYDENVHTRLVMKMSKNIRYLYQQFQENVFNENEFENFKQFIDTSFFDLDIPQEIVDYYNNNILQTTDNNENNKNLIVNKDMSDIKKHDEYEENEEEEGVIKNSGNKSMSNTKKSKKSNESSGKKLKQNLNLKKDSNNKKLLQENLLLKQEIIELKAKNIQSQLGKNINIPKKYDPKSLDKNYQVAEDLLNQLNKIMDEMKNQSKSDLNEDEKNKDKNILKNKNKKKSIEKNVNKEKNIGKNVNKEKIKEKKSEVTKKEEKKTDKSEKNSNQKMLEKEYDEDVNFDNMTDEEKMLFLQQNEILRKLQEAAEARGENFDIQDYIAFLEEHNREEEENDDDHF